MFNWIWIHLSKNLKKKIMNQVVFDLTNNRIWIDSVEEYGDSITVKTLLKRIRCI